MTVLTSERLRDRLTMRNEVTRLVVTPLLDPVKQVSDGAIDVRLGRVFSIVRPWASGVGEELDVNQGAPSASLETFVLAFGHPFIIHPHQFVLARTLELVRFPVDLTAYVVGRSSWGRRGLIVATAVVVHPGFAGPITLELRNLGEMPIALYPMDRVAQLVFHDVPVDGEARDDPSQFSGSFEPTLGDVRTPDEERRLREIQKRATRA